jgi:hypothetical protein
MITRRRFGFAAAVAVLFAGLIANAPAAQAGTGTIQLEVWKAAFIVGGSSGRGTLTYGGKSYPLSVTAVSAGWQLALSKAMLEGKVRNINSPEEIAGVYTAAGAGLAVAAGGKAAVMTNAKGVTIELIGTQMGVDFSINLEGLNIRLKK